MLDIEVRGKPKRRTETEKREEAAAAKAREKWERKGARQNSAETQNFQRVVKKPEKEKSLTEKRAEAEKKKCLEYAGENKILQRITERDERIITSIGAQGAVLSGNFPFAGRAAQRQETLGTADL